MHSLAYIWTKTCDNVYPDISLNWLFKCPNTIIHNLKFLRKGTSDWARARESKSWRSGSWEGPLPLNQHCLKQPTNKCKFTISCNLLCVALNLWRWRRDALLLPSRASLQRCPVVYIHMRAASSPQLGGWSMFKKETDFHGQIQWPITFVMHLRASFPSYLDTHLPSSIQHTKSICFGTMEVDKVVMSHRNQTLTTSVDFYHLTTNNNKPKNVNLFR